LTPSGAIQIIPFVPCRRLAVTAACVAAVFLFTFASPAEGKRASTSKKRTVASKTAATKSGANRSTARKKPRAAAGKDAVVLESVDLEIPMEYGPFLPTETYDFPRPPCVEQDTVVEARLHETTEEDTPEPENVADAVEREPPANALTRMARTLGSLLRPKSSETTIRPEDVDLSDLLTAGVQIPVEGVDASNLRDSFLNSRGSHRKHLAIDIGAPKGTPVLAAADGQIEQLRRENRGGISLYQKDSSGRYLLYYCHLSRYKHGIRPGDKVAKGDLIGYVGGTGHVIGGAHLHFSITRLPEDDDNLKAGVAINPYLLFLAAVQ
jgi:murein DD-endopeptidase MepM/ murein hydrolase activator NlpD